MKSTLIFVGGELGNVKFARLPPYDYAIAADSGLHSADALGVKVDIAIGDFDSVDAKALSAAEERGTKVQRHAAMKDATDLELSIDHAMEVGSTSVTLVGGIGGRLDHLLGNVSVMTQDRYAGMRITALMGEATVTIIRNHQTLSGQPGELISLFATRPTVGVTTDGLLFPLTREAFLPASSRGISNEFDKSLATISLESGFLIAVQPGEMGVLYAQTNG